MVMDPERPGSGVRGRPAVLVQDGQLPVLSACSGLAPPAS
jgi:hypothetical protein